MKIEMKTLQAGPDGVRRAGKIYNVPTAEAKTLIDGGFAVEVKEHPEPALEIERAENPEVPEAATGKAATGKAATGKAAKPNAAKPKATAPAKGDK